VCWMVCVFVGLPQGLCLDIAVLKFATGQRKLCAGMEQEQGRAAATLHAMPACHALVW
jgi:hypothetical protein